jgi:anaerobic magnesium-protoporphyrin IX monomethyl ester cyclase
MKVSISFPPIEGGKGIPEIAQNRQFQWFNNPDYIYPMVPAYAATLLKNDGHEVLWDDAIAREITYSEYMERLSREKPDLVVIETKTPVVKAHWKIIGNIKEILPETRVVMVGDHVTALPGESFRECPVDYILTGGDHDFLLLNLCRHLSHGTELESGIWYRKNGQVLNTGQFKQDHDLNQLPFIDRDLTLWQLYSIHNGNYKRLPGTYTMVGRDCWWHRCTFCSWTTLYPEFRLRKPESLLDEIGMLIDRYGVREVFDDTGTFPTGKWLDKFCRGMIDRGYSRRVSLGCNLRFNAVNQEQFYLMKKAGFRILLFGLESASQKTLDRLNKGIKVDDIIEGCRMAARAGLEPHITIMLGYPWETREDGEATISLARYLFNKGYASTLQATIVIPYPGTPLFKECTENNWLTTEDWDGYDMRQTVMKSALPADDIKKMTQELYRVFFSPRYIMRRLVHIRDTDDLKFGLRGLKAIFSHLKDFSTVS